MQFYNILWVHRVCQTGIIHGSPQDEPLGGEHKPQLIYNLPISAILNLFIVLIYKVNSDRWLNIFMNNKSSFKIEIKRIIYNLDLLFYKNGVIIKNRTASQVKATSQQWLWTFCFDLTVQHSLCLVITASRLNDSF